mmetsp:Transcript_18476/g.57336  ORF Transcript_18476/g.57336 Transcript_18476/m.57336 type:complete len:213 (-) Transcript_18476:115-753(-)
MKEARMPCSFWWADLYARLSSGWFSNPFKAERGTPAATASSTALRHRRCSETSSSSSADLFAPVMRSKLTSIRFLAPSTPSARACTRARACGALARRGQQRGSCGRRPRIIAGARSPPPPRSPWLRPLLGFSPSIPPLATRYDLRSSASCAGVRPRLSRSTSACGAASRSAPATWLCPCASALCRGVCPSLSCLAASPPAARSACVTCRCPA